MKNNKDRSWIDSLAKILPGIAAMIAGILIPLVIHTSAERNRSSQLYADILSKREVADSDLRSKMFENLMKYFFGESISEKSVKEKLILLRLLALNFHESFDLKPLFEFMESELNKSPFDNEEEKEELKKIAKEIVGKQEALLAHIKEGLVVEKTMYEGEENGIMVPALGEKAYKGHRIGIVVTKIKKDSDYAEIRIIDIPEETKEEKGDNAEIPFRLSYYDMPFTDNTKLFNGSRFAITLKDILTDENERRAVNMKVIFFSDNYVSSRDRPYIDEMLGQLKKIDS